MIGDNVFNTMGVTDAELGAKLFDLLQVSPLLLTHSNVDMMRFKEIISFAQTHPNALSDFKRVVMKKTNPEIPNMGLVHEFVRLSMDREETMQELDQLNRDIALYLG